MIKLKIFLFVCCITSLANAQKLQTQFATFNLNGNGFITSIKSKQTGREYNPAGMTSPLMSLCKNKQYILPVAANYNNSGQQILLTYPNGSVATIKAVQKQQYVYLQLVSLTKREGIDNIVWGPYKTTISKTIGDIISVVRSDDFAIGMLGLNDNTVSGPPTDGDMSFMYYYIHSPDPKKYPLPAHLKEGQTFKIGGDGISDIAFYSQPEEYYRMCYGNGASLEPSFGSSICMQSRDRRKEQMIRFPVLPPNVDGGFNSARYQLVLPTDADFMGSAIALYACPDSLGLQTIEKIVLNEGLPHPEVDGKWVKDPASFRPDIAWWGAHDSLASYTKQLGLKAVQDEGWGEYYPNPENRWGHNKISFHNGNNMTVSQYGALMQKESIRYGLHTLCEFLQPNNNSDVAPVPSDSLAIMMRTTITSNISESDTVITVADTSHFNEFGGWEGNHTNVLKIGKELIEYNGITTKPPYTFLHVKRGFHGTSKGSYKPGTTIVKLQPNCYHGFAPDMNLQEVYADYYGKWLTEGGMDYIDFDGLESCVYQGHGQYSFKRFFRTLFDSYKKSGGDYLRVMGSCVYEGNWHYMSVCNVGGGDHMFSPVQNKWGIEGKDMRYVFESNYFPATFGIQSFASNWTIYDAENLEAKSIGWNATYMLGLSKEAVENNPEKEAIFSAYRTWQYAREAGVFTNAWKNKLKDLDYKFHLQQKGNKFTITQVKENRQSVTPSGNNASETISVSNSYKEQPLQLSIKVSGSKDASVAGMKIVLANGKEIVVNSKLLAGQYIISRNNQLFITDAHRKVLSRVETASLPLLSHGNSKIQVAVVTKAGEGIKLDIVVTTIGESQEI
ncbi:hypothetical protein QTN47_18615 [Danxiaibacter flavus]|uniref:Uncharacterized protein n=1 Tax=Danxiaibacter flavus TaxID=3049108 RepID=A0ABV3ZI69_9BACT|nr:hypothetical protein QNM32_18625 [Chitinophagaceae bacterium DXS]